MGETASQSRRKAADSTRAWHIRSQQDRGNAGCIISPFAAPGKSRVPGPKQTDRLVVQACLLPCLAASGHRRGWRRQRLGAEAGMGARERDI